MHHPDPWFASDPDKAWAERYFLLQTPVWIAAVALVIVTGWVHRWSDPGYLAFGVVAMAPAVVGPYVLGRPTRLGTPPHAVAYWIKFNVWCAIVVGFGTYFGTHYFFDLMGMRYAFPVRWTFSSAVTGRTPGEVPIFMYPLTQAYFVSYYAALVVVVRGVSSKWRLGRLGRALLILVLAYAVAFGETFFMANEALSDAFQYADRERMLALGSFGYAIYFVIGLPMVRRIDESRTWTLGEVAQNALATCMLIALGLEAWAHLVGPL